MKYSIRLGVCCGPDKIETIRALGFDYAELCLTDLEAMSEEAYQQLKVSLPEDFRVEACNGLISGKYPLSDERYDREACRAYLHKALGREAGLGGKIAVFGSSGARNVPEGADREKAYEQLVDFARILAEEAEAVGITAVVEPLNKKESNILNSVEEGRQFALKVDRPAFQVLADLYHVELEKEPLSDLTLCGPMLRHCHIANPEGRFYPCPGDVYDYRPFFEVLKEIGYNGRVSLEGGCRDFAADCAAALAYLRPMTEE